MSNESTYFVSSQAELLIRERLAHVKRGSDLGGLCLAKAWDLLMRMTQPEDLRRRMCFVDSPFENPTSGWQKEGDLMVRALGFEPTLLVTSDKTVHGGNFCFRKTEI